MRVQCVFYILCGSANIRACFRGLEKRVVLCKSYVGGLGSRVLSVKFFFLMGFIVSTDVNAPELKVLVSARAQGLYASILAHVSHPPILNPKP